MSDQRPERSRRRGGGGGRGCGIGCGTFIFVLIVGGILSLFSADFGLGASVRVPFTQSNITLAGSIGGKDKAAGGLPNYTQGRIAGTQNLINGTQTATIGPAEGILVFIVGRQAGAPGLDLHITLR